VEVFERAAAEGGRLLKVDQLPLAAGSGNDAVALVLTFDVGRILVSFDSASSCLVATHVAELEDVPSGTVDASEAEPWWRLLGAPIVGVTEAEAGACLRLEFQVSGARPRTLALASDGIRLRAAIETGG